MSPVLGTILGSPDTEVIDVPFGAAAQAAALTTEVIAVPRTGYITAAKIVPVGAATADATDKRTWAVVDASSKAPTDGCIVDPAAGKGAWSSATAYVAKDWVVLNNIPYVCIVGVTGGTGPGVDTSHWQVLAAVGLQYVNFLAAALTKDDIGKTISDSGNTDIPASSFVIDVVAANGATAAVLGSAAPIASGQAANSATAAIVQPSQGALPNQVNGVAVITRTCTLSSAARTLGSFTCSTVSLVAGTPISLVLSTTDTKVFAGDVVKLTSTAVGAGVADPGGTLHLEITSVAEGTD